MTRYFVLSVVLCASLWATACDVCGIYLGVLPNKGGWQDLYNIFLEPATGPLDRLDVARLHRQHSTVAGGSVYEWHLTLRLSPEQPPS